MSEKPPIINAMAFNDGGKDVHVTEEEVKLVLESRAYLCWKQAMLTRLKNANILVRDMSIPHEKRTFVMGKIVGLEEACGQMNYLLLNDRPPLTEEQEEALDKKVRSAIEATEEWPNEWT